jgi:hypothetical protein
MEKGNETKAKSSPLGVIVPEFGPTQLLYYAKPDISCSCPSMENCIQILLLKMLRILHAQ